MLALTRKMDESLLIDLRQVDFSALSDADKVIELKVLDISGDESPKVRIGCFANRQIPIHRAEIVRDVHWPGRSREPRDLMSAAPQLLAACKRIWNDWKNHHQIHDPDWEGYAALRLVLAALNLAEPDMVCPTCGGSGEVIETHESCAIERLGCPHCMGTGRKDEP